MKNYPKYKNTDIEWIAEIPKHWQLKKLKWICTITGGATPSSKNEDYWDGSINWITTADLGSNLGKYISSSNRTITELGLHSIGNKIFSSNSIVISNRAPIGYVFMTTVASATNQGCKTIHHISEHTDYLYYYLLIHRTEIEALGKGTTFKELSTFDLGNFIGLLPPLKEQENISAFLDYKTTLIDKLIAKNERLINLLEEKRKAIINQAVTKGLDPEVKMKDSAVDWIGEIPEHWSYSKLKWKSVIYAGGTPSTTEPSYWEDGDIPWLNSGSVTQKIITKASNYITKKGLEESSAKMIRAGSLLMALAGQGKTKGTVAITKIDTTCNQSLGVIDTCNDLLGKYEFYYLESKYKEIRGLAGDSKRDGLNLSILGDIFSPLPPLNEQKQIANYLDQETAMIDSVAGKIRTQNKLLKEYRQSLISHVVTGKVDVRDEVKMKKKSHG